MSGVLEVAQRPASLAAVAPSTPASATLDLCALHAELRRAVLDCAGRGEAIAGLTEFLRRLMNAAATAYFQRSPAGDWTCVHRAQAPGRRDWLAEHAPRLGPWLAAAEGQQRAQVNWLNPDAVALCVPVDRETPSPGCLAVILLPGAEPIESFVVILQLTAVYLALWNAAQDAQALDDEARHAAAIVDLVQKLSLADDLQTACHTLTNTVQAYVGCDRVVVGLRRRRGGRCRLASVSGMADVDARSDLARRLEAMLDEAILRDALLAWPDQAAANDRAAEFSELATLLGVESLLCGPLHAADGAPLGAWALLGDAQFAAGETHRRLMAGGAPAIGTALGLSRRAQPGVLGRAWRHAAAALPLLRGRALWAVAAVAVLACFLPAPYYVSVDCELQPVVRRYVAAPHAGEFEKSLVKPGDLVAHGQVLGRMEGREIRWELAGLTADQQRACKSRDVNMAAGKTAAAQIDQLEADRLEVKRKLLARRLENLEVKSPIDGIVVSGDLQRSEGVPVSVGQILYEVAPLEHMTAELAIPDEEIAHVAAAMPVTLWLDAHFGTVWSGTITRIHPRAVTREKDNVFLGEIPLENAGHTLRPGMKGHARIRTTWHALGWILFHKPWNYLLTWLEW